MEERVLVYLQEAGGPVPKDTLRQAFWRHRADLWPALEGLEGHGLVRRWTEETGGRSRMLYEAIPEEEGGGIDDANEDE
jgi:predicted transcriptional regulator